MTISNETTTIHTYYKNSVEALETIFSCLPITGHITFIFNGVMLIRQQNQLLKKNTILIDRLSSLELKLKYQKESLEEESQALNEIRKENDQNFRELQIIKSQGRELSQTLFECQTENVSSLQSLKSKVKDCSHSIANVKDNIKNEENMLSVLKSTSFTTTIKTESLKTEQDQISSLSKELYRKKRMADHQFERIFKLVSVSNILSISFIASAIAIGILLPTIAVGQLMGVLIVLTIGSGSLYITFRTQRQKIK